MTAFQQVSVVSGGLEAGATNGVFPEAEAGGCGAERSLAGPGWAAREERERCGSGGQAGQERGGRRGGDGKAAQAPWRAGRYTGTCRGGQREGDGTGKG